MSRKTDGTCGRSGGRWDGHDCTRSGLGAVSILALAQPARYHAADCALMEALLCCIVCPLCADRPITEQGKWYLTAQRRLCLLPGQCSMLA